LDAGVYTTARFHRVIGLLYIEAMKSSDRAGCDRVLIVLDDVRREARRTKSRRAAQQPRPNRQAVSDAAIREQVEGLKRRKVPMNQWVSQIVRALSIAGTLIGERAIRKRLKNLGFRRFSERSER